MNKKLAIKGHSTRGKEVIELLEMMGGKNIHNHTGEANMYSYYLFDYAILHDRLSITEDDDFEIFTLEEFLEKYPYKVGDKVFLYDNITEGCITGMKWDEETVKYCVYTSAECWCDVKDLLKWNAIDLVEKHYKEQDNMETTVESNKRDREDVLFDSIIWHLRNSVNNGKQHLSGGDCEAYFRELVKKVKMYKPVYPETFKECCKIIYDIPNYTHCGYRHELLFNFQKLLICRDAYWKIAGEQMGLNESWKPSLVASNGDKWVLYNCGGTIIKDNGSVANNILVFTTSEMRDAFYENFKDLIEQCKELL